MSSTLHHRCAFENAEINTSDFLLSSEYSKKRYGEIKFKGFSDCITVLITETLVERFNQLNRNYELRVNTIQAKLSSKIL